MARVGLVFGGRSVEHRVSVVSARTVAGALAEAGHEVEPFGIDRDGRWVDATLASGALAGERDALEAAGQNRVAGLTRLLDSSVEVVFPLVHGTWGEDGTLQGFLEIVDLPYVGAGVTASAIAMDKRLAKALMRRAGLPVVDWREVTAAAFESDREASVASAAELAFPLFVKPSVGGSSVGIRKVPDASRLASSIEFALRFDGVALVERGVVGARELECSLVGYPRLEASVLGEVIPGREFYDYADKYLEDGAQLLAPADLEPETDGLLRGLAIEAFAAIGGTSMARVDFLLHPEEGPFINEINTLPGFTSISMYPRLWGLSGFPLPDLVDRLVRDAFARHRDRARLNDGIRDWLAALE